MLRTPGHLVTVWGGRGIAEPREGFWPPHVAHHSQPDEGGVDCSWGAVSTLSHKASKPRQLAGVPGGPGILRGSSGMLKK